MIALIVGTAVAIVAVLIGHHFSAKPASSVTGTTATGTGTRTGRGKRAPTPKR